MTARRRRGPLVLLLLLLFAVLGGALWLALDADTVDPPDGDEPTTPAAALPDEQKPARAMPTTPRERVGALPPERAPNDVESGESRPFEDAPTHSPVAPTRTVHITVEREGGVPVRDAHVAAFSGFGVIRFTPTDACTDIEGKATLDILGTNNFHVRAWTRDSAAISERISVQPDAELHVTLTLQPAYAIAGRVLSDAALGVSGAIVTVRPVTLDPFGLSVSGACDGDGRFDLGSLPIDMLAAGETRVLARARGFAALDVAFEELRTSWDHLVLTLERGQILHGRCVAAGSLPVAGVRVRMEGVEPVVTGRDGTFELIGVSREGGLLDVHPPQHVVPPPVPVLPGTGDVDVGDIVLTAGHPVAGIVVDERAQPVKGATIYVMEEESGRQVRFTQADDEGRFEAPHIGAGPHTVVAITMGGGDWSSQASAKVDGVMAGTTGLRVVISGGLTLVVSFRREADREPVEVASAEVEVTRTDVESGRTVSAWAGPGMTSVRVTFEEPGRYQVVVKVPGYEPATLEDIEILADRPTLIDALFRREPE